VPCGDLHITQVDAGVEHGGHEGVAEHVWVHPGQPGSAELGKPPQAAGGGVPVHSGAAGVQQDRPAGAGCDCPVDRPGDRWW
jgi:hypothetical protein